MSRGSARQGRLCGVAVSSAAGAAACAACAASCRLRHAWSRFIPPHGGASPERYARRDFSRARRQLEAEPGSATNAATSRRADPTSLAAPCAPANRVAEEHDQQYVSSIDSSTN